MRNGPCRWKTFRIVAAIAGHAAVGKAVSAAPTREGPREGVVRPNENRSRRSDRNVRGRPHRPHGEQQAPNGTSAPNGVDAGRRSGGPGDVIAPLPRPYDGSQNPPFPPGAQAPGMHRELTSTGTRSRESLGSRHRSDVSPVLERSQRRKAVCPCRCLARRKPPPRLDQNPDDAGGGRERAKMVRRIVAVLLRVSRED